MPRQCPRCGVRRPRPGRVLCARCKAELESKPIGGTNEKEEARDALDALATLATHAVRYDGCYPDKAAVEKLVARIKHVLEMQL